MSVSGKRILVTGGSSGIGAHLAGVLAREGAIVWIAARRADRLEDVARRIRAAGGQANVVALDVLDEQAIDRAIEKEGPFDVLVNNAGIARTGAALNQTSEDWDAVIDINLKGMFLVAKAVARSMRHNRIGGSIINIASVLGLRQIGGVLPYAVSKAGVVQLTKVLALELARHDIRVNALAPGYLATDLNQAFFESEAGKAMIGRIPQRRLGELRDLEGPVLLLASEDSRYITGAVLPVDGGHLVSGL